MKRYKIKYYMDESAYKIDCPAFIQYWNGDRQSAIYEANRMLKTNPNFKYYQIEEE